MSTGSLRVVLCSVVACAAFAPVASAREDAAAANVGCDGAQRMLAAASALRTFDDFIEDTSGPDICAENAVTNDNEGTITFGLHIHNREGFAAGERYGVFLDTDNNAATGVEGADFFVRVSGDAVELSKWDGASFAPQAELPAAEWAPRYGPVFQLRAADIGNPQSFGFFFFSTNGDSVDFAPDDGAWSYHLAPLELAVRGLALDRARAGRAFSARMSVTRSDFDVPLTEGAVVCAAKLGSTSIAGRGSFAGSRVRCTFRLPRNARGKRIRGSVAVTFQGVEAKRSFTAIVR